ncbi:MAG: transposase, partial [Candidatus Saccharimonadales bacterium]
YALGVTSSRRLEQRIREDLGFRYLAGGAQPDHWTLNEFRRRHPKALNNVFTQVVEIARAAGLGRLGHVAIDSTRVKANASRDRIETERKLRQERAKLRRQIRRWQKACDAEGAGEAPGVVFSEAQRAKLEERLATIPSQLQRLKKSKLRRRSETDPESRFLKARQGFVLGYTPTLAVSEDHLIVEQRVGQNATDYESLVPVVEAVTQRWGEPPVQVSADSGFFTLKNVHSLEKSGIDVYVPDAVLARELNTGQRVRGAAPVRDEAQKRMRQKLRSGLGRALYGLRKTLIEPVFGVLKEQRGMRQFRRRGLEKVQVEWSLATTAYNLTRLWQAAGVQ